MRVAIVGASGAVGLEIVKILQERKFIISELSLFGSQRSAGKSILYKNKQLDEITMFINKNLINTHIICKKYYGFYNYLYKK